jgi:hypothetical protein
MLEVLPSARRGKVMPECGNDWGRQEPKPHKSPPPNLRITVQSFCVIWSENSLQHVASLLFIYFSDPAQLVISHGSLQELSRIVTNPGLTEFELEQRFFVAS